MDPVFLWHPLLSPAVHLHVFSFFSSVSLGRECWHHRLWMQWSQKGLCPSSLLCFPGGKRAGTLLTGTSALGDLNNRKIHWDTDLTESAMHLVMITYREGVTRKTHESPCNVDVQFSCCLACFPLPHLSNPARGHCGNVARIILHVLEPSVIYVTTALQLDTTASRMHFE